MRCRSVRAKVDFDDNDKPVVCLEMGNMRRVGAIDLTAWAELPPGMAREIAANLIRAADEVEAGKKAKEKV